MPDNKMRERIELMERCTPTVASPLRCHIN
jgi:hypothetical protein